MAQWIRRGTSNPKTAGSSPAVGSFFLPGHSDGTFFRMLWIVMFVSLVESPTTKSNYFYKNKNPIFGSKVGKHRKRIFHNEVTSMKVVGSTPRMSK